MRKNIILLAAMILCAGILHAQKPENILAAVGTPPNPKVHKSDFGPDYTGFY